MPRTGRGRRWPNARGCRSPRWGGSGRRSGSSRTLPRPSSSAPTRSSSTRCVIWWGCTWTRPSMPQRRTHDYARNGITSLFAALDVASGKVIGSIHRRHRSVEFRKFLVKLDKQVPAELDVHLICDNYATHKTDTIQRWLAAHPRFQLHFVPTSSSWLNLVERWFSELTTKSLQRGVHKSVQALEADIRTWIETWNEDPRPFVWTKTADEILDSLAAYCQRISGAGH